MIIFTNCKTFQSALDSILLPMVRQALSLYFSVKNELQILFTNCKNQSRDGENAMNIYKNQLRVEI